MSDWVRKALDDPNRDAELMRRGEEVSLFPLVGYSTGTFPDHNVMAAFQVLCPPPDSKTRILRLVMSRSQCIALSQSLERLARTPHVVQKQNLEH